MSKEVTDILKENLYALATDSQKAELDEIFSQSIDISDSGTLDVEKAEKGYITLEDLLNDYIEKEL